GRVRPGRQDRRRGARAEIPGPRERQAAGVGPARAPDHPGGRALRADPGGGDRGRGDRQPDRDPGPGHSGAGRGRPDGGRPPGGHRGVTPAPVKAVEMKEASETAVMSETEMTDEAAAHPKSLALSCVILTMGDRPAEVNRAIDSVRAQRGPQVELVVVGNGTEVTALPAGVKTVSLPENVGVAAGRNAGVEACRGDVVLFLDDDGWYPDTGLAAHVAAAFAADPALAVLSMQVVDPDGGPGARWHVPRLRAGDPDRSSVVTTFLGGAAAIRRSAYIEAGGRPGMFFFSPEGSAPGRRGR